MMYDALHTAQYIMAACRSKNECTLAARFSHVMDASVRKFRWKSQYGRVELIDLAKSPPRERLVIVVRGPKATPIYLGAYKAAKTA